MRKLRFMILRICYLKQKKHKSILNQNIEKKVDLNEYIKNTGIDAIIVTTDDLAGFEINDYIYHFYDYNDFQNIGISFVLYTNNGNPSVFVGRNGPKGSEVFNAYPDATISSVLKTIYTQHIAKGNYVGAFQTYIQLIDGIFVKVYGQEPIGTASTKSFPWVEVIVISFALSFIIVLLVISKYQRPLKLIDYTVKNSVNETTMIVKCEHDRPVVANTGGNS